jgi:hypothetical protein
MGPVLVDQYSSHSYPPKWHSEIEFSSDDYEYCRLSERKFLKPMSKNKKYSN